MNNGPLTSAGAVHGITPSSPPSPTASDASDTSDTSDTEPETTAITSTEKLSAENAKKWDDTMAMIQWCAPGFRHIWYKLLVQDGNEYNAVMSKRVPVAATDGQNLIINPDTFFEYKIRERAFIGGHEILHAIFDDCGLLHKCQKSETVPMHDGTTLPFVNETMQISMDLRTTRC